MGAPRFSQLVIPTIDSVGNRVRPALLYLDAREGASGFMSHARQVALWQYCTKAGPHSPQLKLQALEAAV